MEKFYNIKTAHMFCSDNEKQLSQSMICGCFYCLAIFNPKEIIDWCDDGKTGICPHCNVDSILPEIEGIPLNKEYLTQMHNYWF